MVSSVFARDGLTEAGTLSALRLGAIFSAGAHVKQYATLLGREIAR